MCFCNCPFERYPNGPNEDCKCRRPEGAPCWLDADEEDEDGHDS